MTPECFGCGRSHPSSEHCNVAAVNDFIIVLTLLSLVFAAYVWITR